MAITQGLAELRAGIMFARDPTGDLFDTTIGKFSADSCNSPIATHSNIQSVSQDLPSYMLRPSSRWRAIQAGTVVGLFHKDSNIV